MNSIRLLCAVAMAAYFPDASAQDPVPGASPAVASPARLDYRSAFVGYRAYREPELRSWRKANDEAGALRGHAGHLEPPPPPAASTTKPAAAVDGGRSK